MLQNFRDVALSDKHRSSRTHREEEDESRLGESSGRFGGTLSPGNPGLDVCLCSSSGPIKYHFKIRLRFFLFNSV